MSEHILDAIDLRDLGKRLQLARKRQGLTQADAARIIGVARTTVTAVEKGDRRIKASELMKLAEAYGREVSDFVTDRPIIDRPVVQFRSAFSRTVEDEKLIAPFVIELTDLCSDYLELERITGKSLVRNYPSLYQYDHYSGRSEQAAEGIAIAERNRLGLGDAPLPILRDFLEKHVGLRIFYLPLKPSQSFSEIYFFDSRAGGCIAINSSHPVGRRRWSLAHAYAHFLVHRSKPNLGIIDQYQRKPESERFADNFATYFLLPTYGVTQRFNAMHRANGRITPADLVQLAHYYGASFQALVLRLENMRLLPSGIWDKLNSRGFRVKDAQERLGLAKFPDSDEMLPARYQQLAIEAFEDAEISEGQLARFLREDRLTARTIAENLGKPSDVLETIDHDVLELAGA